MLTQRREERARVTSLKARLANIEPGRYASAKELLQQALDEAQDRLAAIEAELAGGEVVVRASDLMTTQQEAKAALRQRLVHLELVLQRHTPPSCESAARRLRQAIHRELRGLEHA